MKQFSLRRLRIRAARVGAEVGEAVNMFAGVAAVWFGFTSLAFATYYIPSESMQPSLEVGDRIVVSKWAYGYSRHTLPLGLGSLLPENWDGRIGWGSPRRGDVVVLWDDRQDLTLIKRVIGVPGDIVAMREGRLFINGAQVDRTLIEARTYRENADPRDAVRVRLYEERLPGGRTHPIYERGDDNWLDEYGPEVVPAGHVFVMGDNRDNSADSRAPEGPGFVRFENIVGRAETVLYTFERCRHEDGLYCPRGRVWRGL
ncbi:signal peptidase I [Maricaulis virginensis]|uniref:Signal peptidase I n=1 Tax=Maricaulis virginensis TaxID=144022 RepID=A0A9W6IKG3_9PROT|nr:signal peptidase I [Maricaulis virginensis]GLK50616.1 signal peptidase I [Maricaulis virginensis]